MYNLYKILGVILKVNFKVNIFLFVSVVIYWDFLCFSVII